MTTSNRRKRIFRNVILTIASLSLLAFFAAWIVAGRLVASCNCEIGDPPSDFPAETICLPSHSERTLAGWHLPSSESRGVIVLVHGIGGSRLSMLDRARWLRSEGFSVVLIDLQAHGESPGEYITIGHLEQHDVRAAVEFARREHPGEPTGVLGVSLGGASALLASPLGIDALVVESVFPDIRKAVHNRVAARLGILSWVPAKMLIVQMQPRFGIDPDTLSPIDHLADVDCPVFIISGADDLHTTAAETNEMFQAAVEPKQLWIVEGAAHVDLLEAATVEYKTRVLKFLDECFAPRSAE